VEKSGKRAAVIGSGPSGLAAAQQLARAGHSVVVFEKDDKPGGLLRYGVPDFKLEKRIIDRRLNQLIAEGVEFQTSVNAGDDISTRYLQKMFDCICLAAGTGQPRDLPVSGRGFENIVFAMDYLRAQNILNDGQQPLNGSSSLSARGKAVVVIGGGDTGSDCVGTPGGRGPKKFISLKFSRTAAIKTAGHSLAELAANNENIVFSRRRMQSSLERKDKKFFRHRNESCCCQLQFC